MPWLYALHAYVSIWPNIKAVYTNSLKHQYLYKLGELSPFQLHSTFLTKQRSNLFTNKTQLNYIAFLTSMINISENKVHILF